MKYDQCDLCGLSPNSTGVKPEIIKVYWKDSMGFKKYSSYRICEDCMAEYKGKDDLKTALGIG